MYVSGNLRKVADPNIFFVGNIIKSPAMNFPSMVLMFKNKSSCLFYFNSVSLLTNVFQGC
jgi:hypothetical protein